MTRRPGLTLTEVLVTLGILAFGLLAILTLFPLAASQMSIAVREDRSAQAATAADSYFRAYWKAEIVDKKRDGLAVTEPFYADLNTGGGFPQAGSDEPSYPVLVDPFGYASRSSTYQGRLGDFAGTNVRRHTLNVVMNNAAYTQFPMRLCSLLDGLGYDEDGRPSQDREYRYNWLWVIQRPQNRNEFTAAMTVVTFDRRPFLYASPGSEAVFTAASVTPGTTSVILSGSADIRPGGWVMDATVSGGLRHANFYQVVTVTDTGSVTQLELQSPIKTRSDASNSTYTATFVVLRGVSGVSFRHPLSSGN